jgi:DNA-binding response OmpR family regulator
MMGDDAKRILVVEDEAHLADGLRFNLEAEGYVVETAADGETALQLLFNTNHDGENAGSKNSDEVNFIDAVNFDAVVLDIMLPGIDGFAVAAELRRRHHFVPVLMLTARGRPEDVLRGFEAGADDYLPKPFELRILIARLGALVRRRSWLRREPESNEVERPVDRRMTAEDANAASRSSEVYTFAGKTFDFNSLELRTGSGHTVQLTLMEAGLLRYLLRHAGQIVSRKQMLEDVWNLHEDTDTRAIDNFIVRLRKYIEPEPMRPRHLLTVRGVGYRFIPD